MKVKVFYYVDQQVNGRIVTTRFTDKTNACVYAENEGGSLREPFEVQQSELARKLFRALEAN